MPITVDGLADEMFIGGVLELDDNARDRCVETDEAFRQGVTILEIPLGAPASANSAIVDEMGDRFITTRTGGN